MEGEEEEEEEEERKEEMGDEREYFNAPEKSQHQEARTLTILSPD